MKINKLTLVAVASSMLASSAFAQKTFYMYGSTAYRKATFQALNTLFTAGSFTSLQYDQGTSGGGPVSTVTTAISSPTSAELGSTNLIWKGKLVAFGSQTVTVYCNWAGSVGGIKSLASGPNRNITHYLLDGGSYGSFSSATNEVAMADCDQTSTLFDNSVDPSFTELNPTLVSVLEFIWARGNGTNAFFSDITNAPMWALQSLLSQGDIPQGQITGNPADNSQLIYLTGRDDDSGTRILALADSVYGTSTAVSQYSCPNGGVYAYASFGPGDGFGGGYSSGGSVKTALITTRPASYKFDGTHESLLMGYIAVTDACNVPALSVGAGSNTLSTVTNAAVPTSQWLSYNGVPWSEKAIAEGNYSYFGYEHLYTRPDAISDVTTFASVLATEQMNQAGASVVPGTMPISVMDIANRGDGAIIAHN
jgi:hypothetical protein